MLVALADAVRRFAIPREHLEHLLEGVEWDLRIARYPDFAAPGGVLRPRGRARWGW